jgi:hypothetical protein
MKHKGDKKRALLLRAQKSVIEFANGFETGFQIPIILEPLLNLGDGLRSNADLSVHAAGISDGEHPDRVSFTSVTLGTALFMPNGAL